MAFNISTIPFTSEKAINRNLLFRNIYSSNERTKQSLPGHDNVFASASKYNDLTFRPIPENIIKQDGRTFSEENELGSIVARWIRPEQIRWSIEAEKYPLTVFNQPHPMDIIQGRLGNCWFTSALSLIAEIPHILEKVMITKQYNPSGIYKIRFCNRGIWQLMTVDDMLPVTQANTLVFTRSRKKQLFPSLIEKALAKMHGSYGALQSGRCVTGLQILTGEPCEVLYLRSSDPKKVPNMNDVWAKIIESRSKGFLMTCLCSNEEINEGIFHQMGLQSDHAYSILDARQIGARRVLRLRNPWGTKTNSEITENNSMELSNISNKNSGVSSVSDGVFWMPWERMYAFLSDITICKINLYGYKAHKSGHFNDFSSTTSSTYILECSSGGELEIELFHVADGNYSNRSKQPELDLFLIILDTNGFCHTYVHGLDYFISLSTTLRSGRYILFAGSMSVLNYSMRPKFNLVVHSSQSFTMHQRPLSRDFVGSAFLAVADKTNKRKDFGDGVSILTSNDSGAFGFICENRSDRAIRLTTDFQGSLNVFSSRKASRLIDVIPAKTKQLFMMLTRKEFSRDVNIVYQVEYQALNQVHGKGYMQAKNNPPIHPQAIGLHVMKSTNKN